MAKRHTFLALGSLLSLLLVATPAWAPFHLMVIDEVFFGTDDCPEAQYVMLRTLSFGMSLVGNQPVDTFAADGSKIAGGFGTFPMHLPNAQTGVAILMGTAQAQELFGLTMDAVVDGELPFADGRVCFGTISRQPVDCVAYGNYTGDNGNHGSPALAPVLGMALSRISETDDNATDFALASPAPENNAGQTGTLGSCGAPPACTGDCDRNNEVTVDEILRGITIALGDASIDDCTAMDADASGTVTVDEIITALTRALEGCG